MAESPLRSLPTELVILIFENLDSFASAASFAACCHYTHEIWAQNTAQIYLSIAPRGLTAFEDANTLIQTPSWKSPSIGSSSPDELMTALRSCSKVAANFTRVFESDTHPRTPRRYGLGSEIQIWHMSPTEHERLVSHLYQLWTLAILPQDEVLSKLRSMSMRHLYALTDLLFWGFATLFDRPEEMGLPPIGLWTELGRMSSEEWDEKANRLRQWNSGVKPNYFEDIPMAYAVTVLDDWWAEFAVTIPDEA